MRVSFERTGGFAGIRMSASIDVDSLDDEQAAELRQMIENADFFQLPTHITGATIRPDMFQYKIRVETDEQQHTVQIENMNPPDAINQLIRHLMVLARSEDK